MSKPHIRLPTLPFLDLTQIHSNSLSTRKLNAIAKTSIHSWCHLPLLSASSFCWICSLHSVTCSYFPLSFPWNQPKHGTQPLMTSHSIKLQTWCSCVQWISVGNLMTRKVILQGHRVINLKLSNWHPYTSTHFLSVSTNSNSIPPHFAEVSFCSLPSFFLKTIYF